jgi:Fic family protein
MKSLSTEYIAQLYFSQEQLTLLKTLGSYQGKQALYYEQSPEALENLKKVATIESTESSNRIEGITAPHKRIEDIVLKASKPKNRSEQEIAGYRDALNLLHLSAKDMPISLNVILQLHQYLYQYLPSDGGKWKNVDNAITAELPDGSKYTRFQPVSAFDTPRFMEKLTLEYRNCIEIQGNEPLIIIPALVLDFLCIHPFRDGNGRTARLLTLLLLYHFGYEVGRYISLERIFEESKETYYEVLEASSNNWHEGKHDIMPWLNYFWGVLIRAYKEFEQRVGTLTTGKGNKSEHIKNTIISMEVPFSISEIERACPAISRDTIRMVLRTLRDEGLIESTGKGRGAKWKKIRK